jgi:hypothetical protein
VSAPLAASFWEIVLPVILGGLLTIAGGFAAEWWRHRGLARATEAQRERQTNQAVRLVFEELTEIALILENAARTDTWWTDRGDSLPTDTWNEYRAVLADVGGALRDHHAFMTTSRAYQMARDLNLRAPELAKISSPRAAFLVRTLWGMVQEAMRLHLDRVVWVGYRRPGDLDPAKHFAAVWSQYGPADEIGKEEWEGWLFAEDRDA